MAEVLHGDGNANQLNARADKSQVYGLKGNDTLTSGGKRDVLLIGGSGDDSLIMSGGNGTLSGGEGNDTFELTYSATKPLSAVIEDLELARDKIVVNFDGDTAPQLSSVTSGNDAVLSDGTRLSVTLKGVRDNDYFDGDLKDEAWKVLELTNAEREKENLPALTMADGLTAAASIRAKEITSLGTLGLLTDHTRPDGTHYDTVFDEVGKIYLNYGENLDGGAATPQEVVEQWMGSESHKENILNAAYKKIGVGYNYDDPDPTNHRWYWTQLFGDSLTDPAPETVSTDKLLTVAPAVDTVSKFIQGDDEPNTIDNGEYGATIDALGGGDSITNSGLIVSISGSNDNDTLQSSGSFTTINAGTGDDLISLDASTKENLIQYAAGEGNDTVSGLNATDTVSISGSEFTPAIFDNDMLVAVGNDSITLLDAVQNGVQILGERSNLFVLTDNDDTLENSLDSSTVMAKGGNDLIYNGTDHDNAGSNVSISGAAGNDVIYNYGSDVTIDGSTGDEYIYNGEKNVSINSGEGDDYIYNFWFEVTMEGGLGNDSLYNTLFYNVTMDGGEGDDLIVNSSPLAPGLFFGDNVSISGGNGNDSIENYGKEATVDCGNGNDTVWNYGANSTIIGGAGNDFFVNAASSVTMDGGDGNDFMFIESRTSNATITGGADDDDIFCQGESITIDAGTGNDTVRNTGTNISITGGAGSDSVSNQGSNVTLGGGAGNDTIELDSLSKNNLIQYSAGDGFDIVTGFRATDKLIIGDGTGTYSSRISGSDIIVTVGDGQIVLKNASYLSAVNIRGSLSGDIFGTNEADSIRNTVSGIMVHALGGNDTVYNGDPYYNGANVTVDGGDGNDTIFSNGYAKNVSINGGAGNDTVRNYSDESTLDGGAGDDEIFVGESYSGVKSVTISGGTGEDTIRNYGEKALFKYSAGDGDDLINGFYSNSTLSISSSYSTQISGADVIVTAGDGKITLQNVLSTADELHINDTVISFADIKLLTFGDGGDSFANMRDEVTIDAGAGSDSITNRYLKVSINGNAGNDTVTNYYGGDSVTIDGGAGNDDINNWYDNAKVTLRGGDGNDHVVNYGDDARVSMDGGAGDDTVYNSSNEVTIRGGKGDDSIQNSLLFNGGNNVLFEYESGDGNDFIEGFTETSTLSISGGSYSTSESGNDFIVTVGEGNITLSNGAKLTAININDSVFAGSGGTKKIVGTSGADSIVNRTEGMTIDGGAGDDYISNEYSTSYSLGGSSVSGGAGDDTISNRARYATLSGGDGNDSIYATSDTLTIDGGAGDDTVYNSAYNTTINGGAGNDSIYNRGDYVKINGGDGNDEIYNRGDSYVYTGGAVTIDGGKGDDTIHSEYGIHYSLSGNSHVKFVYNAGDGNDVIYSFNSTDTLSIAGGEYTRSTIGNDLVFNVGNGSVRLVDAATLSAVNVQGTWDKKVTLTEGNDTYYITTDGVAVNALGGDDDINNIARVLREDGTGYDTVGFSNISINSGTGNDSITNRGDSVTVDGGDGDDLISHKGLNSTIDGGTGNDTLWSDGENVFIDAGTGNDTIENDGSFVTINMGDGNDSIQNRRGSNVSITGGEGDDYVKNETGLSNVVIMTDAGKDSIDNKSNEVTIDGGADDDYIDTWGDYSSITGGDGNDYIDNFAGQNSTVLGGAGDDTVRNSGDSVTVDLGDGNDSINNEGETDSVTISGGAGDDTIDNSGTDVTIEGNAGDDIISLSGNGAGSYINYTAGDGNDIIYGYTANTTINIAGAEYVPTPVGDDIVYLVGNGSITLKDAREKPLPIIIGESGTSGGGSDSGNDSGGNDSGGNSSGGSDGGGQSGGNTSGGTSSNEGRGSAASGGRSASGSSGRSSSSNVSSGGNAFRRHSHSTTTDAPTSTATTNPLAATSTTSTQQTSTAATQRVYSGGNQVIADYSAGEKIVFGATYTGAFFDGAGNFFAGSTTGALVVQNAADKVIDLTDAAGNSFVKAYAATTAGLIDGRGLGGFELINGSTGGDAIYAGDGGSQLWGGADTVSDAMLGGGGTDIFIGGKNQGADYFLNASAADIVHLNDSTLGDIVATAEENGTIGIAFNTGNVVAVQSSEALSATVMLADGSAYRYNHANKSWQTT